MSTTKKVTVHLPEDLLARAQEATGAGITSTIVLGLEAVARSRAYQQIRALRGKVKFSIDLEELREDRTFDRP